MRKFASFHLSLILYKCWVFTLEENNKMSARTTPESRPPDSDFDPDFDTKDPLGLSR